MNERTIPVAKLSDVAPSQFPAVAIPCRLGPVEQDRRGDYFRPLIDADGQHIASILCPDGSDSDEAHERAALRAGAILRVINEGKY